MLPRLREWLSLILLALLPFHALGITVFTRIVVGPNHAPLGLAALWKEAFLAVILLVALVEIIRSPGVRNALKVDLTDSLIFVLVAALGLATVLQGVPLIQAFYGIRYDLVPLAAFFILRRVSWSDAFFARMPFVLAIAATLAALYALTTLVLPEAFFNALGYSDLHSLYVSGRPIAAFQHIGGSAVRRLQGPMSGPNQFGIWLAAVLPFALSLRLQLRRIVAPLLLLVILLTFSRAAWIATAVILMIALWPQIQRLSVTVITTLCIGILAIVVSVALFFPSVILRVQSSADHLRRPLEALSIMMHEPLGRGLGSAGPANNRVADACVFQEAGSDASWAVPHADLCVFVGGVQVQPVGRICTCPLLPENWYLQLGVEGGWIAMVAFMWLIALLLRRARDARSPVFLSLLAVSLAALFLHAWEDAAVAYMVWILCAVYGPTFKTMPTERQYSFRYGSQS